MLKRWVIVGLAIVLGIGAIVPAVAAEAGKDVKGEAYSRLMRALLIAQRGEFRAAADEVREAVKLQPDSPKLKLEAARLLFRLGRVKESEELAAQALAASPDDREVLRFVADRAAERAFGGRGGDDEAIRLYTRLVDGGSIDEHVLRNLYGLQLKEGDREAATRTARTFLEARPGDHTGVGMLVDILLEDGEEEEALAVILGYIGRHPNDTVLVKFADELARKLEAWETVDRVLAEYGEPGDQSSVSQRLWGEALRRLGRFDEAASALERAYQVAPEDPQLGFDLARTYRRLGRLADTTHTLSAFLDEASFEFRYRRAYLLLGETLADQGDIDGAIQVFQGVLDMFARHTGDDVQEVRDRIRIRVALLYLTTDRRERAAETYGDLETPDLPESRELEARIALKAEDWATARRAIRDLDAAGETGPAALLDGELLARTTKWMQARDRFNDAINHLGPRTRGSVAEIYLDLGRPDEGERVLHEWIAADPNSADPRFQLGSYLHQVERFDAAEQALRDAFRLEPTHAPALNFLGYTLAEREERLDEALRLVQRALAIDEWNGAYLDSLGWVYYRMGRYDEARDPLERAAREYPRDSVVLEHLGDLYLQLGELGPALAAWERALEAGSDDALALRGKIAANRERAELEQSADQAERTGDNQDAP